eukprot:6214614-Pleurochrysis_carterae.AAC.2
MESTLLINSSPGAAACFAQRASHSRNSSNVARHRRRGPKSPTARSSCALSSRLVNDGGVGGIPRPPSPPTLLRLPRLLRLSDPPSPWPRGPSEYAAGDCGLHAVGCAVGVPSAMSSSTCSCSDPRPVPSCSASSSSVYTTRRGSKGLCAAAEAERRVDVSAAALPRLVALASALALSAAFALELTSASASASASVCALPCVSPCELTSPALFASKASSYAESSGSAISATSHSRLPGLTESTGRRAPLVCARQSASSHPSKRPLNEQYMAQSERRW